jgi:hypothetical protein
MFTIEIQTRWPNGKFIPFGIKYGTLEEAIKQVENQRRYASVWSHIRITKDGKIVKEMK